MAHYICTGGCGGVSNRPGVCQAKSCPNYGHQLKECDCTDGKHYGILKVGKKIEKEEDKSGEGCC